MLYQTKNEKLTKEKFEDPGSEFRGMPFWAWNCRPEMELLKKELDVLKEMGMGGAHIHSRVGLDIPYLGSEFMHDVKESEEYMKSKGMLCCLYDEDRWPSGSAGGMVTKDHQYRQRYLVIRPIDVQEKSSDTFLSAAAAVRSDEGQRLSLYEIKLDNKGFLSSYVRINGDESDKGTHNIWEARIEVSGDTPWFNNQAYVDVLNKDAIHRFIELTHEKYYGILGCDFGKEIRSVFTDEPQMSLKEVLEDPFERKAVILPYTDNFDDTFSKAYGFSILDRLPELVWELPENNVSVARYLFQRHLVERFSAAFGDQIGNWCEKHGIALTGHMMNEWTLYSQTAAVGEAMRPMKDFAIPGVDMLCDRREFSTVKQAQSVAHQIGREGVMSEIYGVTGWTFDFRGYKLAGDWQAALGVTYRVPHLSWVAMAGEGKRDYPASIGYQAPWYKEYHYIEDHFARLNTALTKGTPHVDVAVIHPIESYWLYWGNRRQTAGKRESIESGFENVIKWLLFGLIDFDFVSEAILSEESVEQDDNSFDVGKMKYHAVVVPGCETLRKNTYERLRAFGEAGGKIVFMGKIPSMIDCVKTDLVKSLARDSVVIDSDENALLEALEEQRAIDITTSIADDVKAQVAQKEVGSRTSNMFYQMRDDGDARWLFICHVYPPKNKDIVYTDRIAISVRGEYKVTYYDTLTGNISAADARYDNGNTEIIAYVSAHDSLLYKLEKTDASESIPEPNCDIEEISGNNECYEGNSFDGILKQTGEYELEEDNVLLLDMAEYSLDDGKWQQEEEILRIDNSIRKTLGYPQRMEALAQPWTRNRNETLSHKLHLRFHIYSDVDISNVMLATERTEGDVYCWNGNLVTFADEGYFTDESIRKSIIGDIRKGENILEITKNFNETVNVEWYYILGKFGVNVNGRQKKVTEFPSKLYFGDYTRQGLPFYAGNLIYKTEIDSPECELILQTEQYRGALVTVSVDGGQWVKSVFAPYRVNMGHMSDGKHEISLKIFGNRANAFGPVHNADREEEWYGPEIWRTSGIKWAYEYYLEPMGILSAPLYYYQIKSKDEKN